MGLFKQGDFDCVVTFIVDQHVHKVNLMHKSEAEPCMLYKEDEKGVCIIIIYIDDMLIIGKEEAIDDAIRVLQGHFQVKDPTSWKII